MDEAAGDRAARHAKEVAGLQKRSIVVRSKRNEDSMFTGTYVGGINTDTDSLGGRKAGK